MKALKNFSQNFLINPEITHQILNTIKPQANETFIEIGPGKGALTFFLSKQIKKLITIEIDHRLIQILQEQIQAQKITNITLIHQDIQKINLSNLNETPVRLISNLPYHLSTAMIIKCIKEKHNLTDIHLTLQKEFAERLFAKSGSKSWGRLSILAQMHMNVQKCFNIEKNNFHPKPKVDSTLVKIKPKDNPLFHIEQPKKFNQLLLAGFQKRRKTMKNALKNHLNHIEFETLLINPEKRAETLSIEQWYKIYCYLKDQK